MHLLIRLIHGLLKDSFLVLLATFVTNNDLVTVHGVLHRAIDGQAELRPVIEYVGVASAVNGVGVAIPHFLSGNRNALHVHRGKFAFLPYSGLGLCFGEEGRTGKQVKQRSAMHVQVPWQEDDITG
jgi:hypothetical protein